METRKRPGRPRLPKLAPPDLLGQPLTDRELEISKEVAKGLQQNQIADALGLSTQTIKNQLTKIYKKTGFHTRARLAVWYTQTIGDPFAN